MIRAAWITCQEDGREYPLGALPLVLGRDPGSDVPVPGDDVSRHHAYLLRTPQGIVVVDTSLHGTFVNGDRVQAQRLLADHDVIQVGVRSFRFRETVSPSSRGDGDEFGQPSTADRLVGTRVGRPSTKADVVPALAARPTLSAKAGVWVRRYGVPELAGLSAALAGAWLVHRATDSAIAAAYGASIGESLGFYGTVVVREMVREAYAAGARRAPYGLRQMAATWRGLLLEFGPAELADTALLRPFAMWIGVDLLGRPLGILAGKLLADLAFYGPVIAVYELRRRRGSVSP